MNVRTNSGTLCTAKQRLGVSIFVNRVMVLDVGYTLLTARHDFMARNPGNVPQTELLRGKFRESGNSIVHDSAVFTWLRCTASS